MHSASRMSWHTAPKLFTAPLRRRMVAYAIWGRRAQRAGVAPRGAAPCWQFANPASPTPAPTRTSLAPALQSSNVTSKKCSLAMTGMMRAAYFFSLSVPLRLSTCIVGG